MFFVSCVFLPCLGAGAFVKEGVIRSSKSGGCFFRNATSSWFSLSPPPLTFAEGRIAAEGGKFEQNLRPEKTQKTPRWSAEVTHLFWVVPARVASTASCFQIRPHFPAFREEREEGGTTTAKYGPQEEEDKKVSVFFSGNALALLVKKEEKVR